jgi:hypothetical protein
MREKAWEKQEKEIKKVMREREDVGHVCILDYRRRGK